MSGLCLSVVSPSLTVFKRSRPSNQVRDLKEEIRLLRGEQEERGPLTADEIARLQGTVRRLPLAATPIHALSAVLVFSMR